MNTNSIHHLYSTVEIDDELLSTITAIEGEFDSYIKRVSMRMI